MNVCLPKCIRDEVGLLFGRWLIPSRCKYALLTPSWSLNTGNKQFICVPVKVDKLSRQQSRRILATSQLPIVQMARPPPLAPILCWIDRKTGWDAQNTGKIPSSLVQTPPPRQWSARIHDATGFSWEKSVFLAWETFLTMLNAGSELCW